LFLLAHRKNGQYIERRTKDSWLFVVILTGDYPLMTSKASLYNRRVYNTNMTLIVAVRTKQGVMVAGDSLGQDSDTLEIKYDFEKVRAIANKFAFGMSGCVIGESMMDDTQSRVEGFVEKTPNTTLDNLVDFLTEDLYISYKIWASKKSDFFMSLIVCDKDRFITIYLKYPDITATHPIYSIGVLGMYDDAMTKDIEVKDNFRKRINKYEAIQKTIVYMKDAKAKTGLVGGRVDAIHITSTGIKHLATLVDLEEKAIIK